MFHTPGPVWNGGHKGEPEKLTSCYRTCLETADKKQVRSLAFCSISTGIYGYPLDAAAPLAVQTVRDYLVAHPETSLRRIVFAMFQASEYDVFTRVLADLPGDTESRKAGAY